MAVYQITLSDKYRTTLTFYCISDCYINSHNSTINGCRLLALYSDGEWHPTVHFKVWDGSANLQLHVERVII
jgi:hypothetical protein